MTQSVSNLTCAKDIYSKIASDAAVGTAVGGYNATFRVLASQSGGNPSTIYPNIIPLRAPCNYSCVVKISAIATDGTVSGQSTTFWIEVFQLTSGGALFQSGAIGLAGSALSAGAVVPIPLIIGPTFTKNPTNDAIDVTTGTGAGTQGRPCNFVIDITITNAVNY